MSSVVSLDLVNRAVLKSSHHQAKVKAVQDALTTLDNWRSVDNTKLKKALELISTIDSIAQQAAPELVDILANYKYEYKQGQERKHYEKYPVILLAIKAALFSPDTKGLKEALANVFKQYPGSLEAEIELKAEIIKAFQTVVKVDQDVTDALASILPKSFNDGSSSFGKAGFDVKVNSMKLEILEMLKVHKADSEKVMNALAEGLKESRGELLIAIAQTLAQNFGARAVRILPAFAYTANYNSQCGFFDSYGNASRDSIEGKALINSMNDICKAADLKLQKKT